MTPPHSSTVPPTVGRRIRLATQFEEAYREGEYQLANKATAEAYGLTLLADDMLESVFRNLLHNAIVHNDKELPEVTVSVILEEETVRVRVADNGPGIPERDKERIFDEGKTGLDSQGTRLGLYLVETLVERYGGDIELVDNDPEGSVFIVELLRAD